MTKNILITGIPGIGKTTLIKELAENLKSLNPAGFYTEEIREGGSRLGFGLASFDGHESILSHVKISSRFRVGKYRVDIAGFESFLEQIDFFDPKVGLVIIDEIGKMECFSDRFKKLILDLLDSEKGVIATIAMKGGGMIEKVKRRPDVKIFEITRDSRDRLASLIAAHIG
jgi:nucleoside-triphosphatase